MIKHNGVYTYSAETLNNIREIMNNLGKEKEVTTLSTINFYKQFYTDILLELEKDLGDYFFGDVDITNTEESKFDFETGSIILNPETTVKKMEQSEFIVKKCRYAGANAKSKADYPTSEEYADIYHLLEILINVTYRDMFNASTDNNDLNRYYHELRKKLSDPKVISSKKFSKAEILMHIRRANILAGKTLCEVYKDAKTSSKEGCFAQLGYILFTESLCSGYSKKDLFKSTISTTPIIETNNVVGLKGNSNLVSLSLEERAINGIELSDKEKTLIKSISFDESQGKARGTFGNFYGAKGIF